MKTQSQFVYIYVTVLFLLLLGALFIIPWRLIHWGNIAIEPSQTVIVTGTAKTEQTNQVATFNAGINEMNDNKETAVKEANQKTKSIIDAVKGFGIPTEDIKTQNLNVFQMEEMYYDGGSQKSRPGQWRVSNNIEIKLRDIEKASALTDLLTQTGATNVYGPNFALDNTDKAENLLLAQAIENAKGKAQIMAKSSNHKLGKILSVVEGSQNNPIMPMYSKFGGGGGGADLEVGTNTVQKTVTVTFELK